METFLPALASGVVSAALAAFSCYVALTNRLTRLETMLETLTKDVEQHNKVVERTYKLESDLHTAFKHIDIIRDEVQGLRKENV